MNKNVFKTNTHVVSFVDESYKTKPLVTVSSKETILTVPEGSFETGSALVNPNSSVEQEESKKDSQYF